MNFSENIVCVGNIDRGAALKHLRNQHGIMNVYLVCSGNGVNSVLEIYHSPEIFKPMVKFNNIKVLALCEGKKNAVNVCMDILLEKYKADGNFIL